MLQNLNLTTSIQTRPILFIYNVLLLIKLFMIICKTMGGNKFKKFMTKFVATYIRDTLEVGEIKFIKQE